MRLLSDLPLDDPRVGALWRDLRSCGGLAVSRLLQCSLGQEAGETGGALALAAAHGAWEKLHTGDWKDVAGAWRDAYTLAALLQRAHGTPDALRALDLATLVGGAAFRPELERAAEAAAQQERANLKRRRKGEGGDSVDSVDAALRAAPPLGTPPPGGLLTLPPGAGAGGVARAELPSLEAFATEQMAGVGQPLLLTGLLSDWPALQLWRDAAYLAGCAGERTVPVEVGEHYLAPGWRQELTPLRAFLAAHLCAAAPPEPAARAYLAQHALFEQVPRLQEDIRTPDYCALGARGCVRACNAWLGPAGTVTPLHTDPDHNLLCQVVGTKHVRLYAPGAGGEGALYPHDRGHVSNSSRVDVMRPDADAFPRFAGTPFLDCELRAGEALYIPPRWWHFVMARTTSFSVNFFWD